MHSKHTRVLVAGICLSFLCFVATPSWAQLSKVDGDFVTFDAELQPVLKALRASNINIVAIHNHMGGESPKAIFLHYWGIGPAEKLAEGVKAALDAQAKITAASPAP